MKTIKFVLVLLLISCPILISAQDKNPDKVKNVIILIPDGSSSGVLTLARWFNNNNPLAIDPVICGMVKTYNSDGKFPDSAPTSTAYATGTKTMAPYIGIDSNANPQISVLELAKIKGLSTGIVVTSEFPHATPADFVCHFDSRESDKYTNLAKQFIYNTPSLVFAGGKKYLEDNNYLGLLEPNGIELITDLSSFEKLKNLPLSGKSIWGLFPDWRDSTKHMSFECDRDISKAPGLSQMTSKAIDLLSKNEKGFLLMVEGSQVDWAAHYNDPYALVTDFLEFDKSVSIALEFAAKNKNTVVIVCPDHGTGGISIGNDKSGVDFFNKNPNKYDKINIKERIIDSLMMIKWSGRKLAEMMLVDKSYISKDSILKYYNLSVNDEMITSFTILSEIKSPATIDTLQYLLGSSFSKQHFIGWTTTGHTAEDVFLGIYAPENSKRKTGVVDNSEIGRYIAEIMDLGDLRNSSAAYYRKHTDEFFRNKVVMEATPDSLVIRKNNKQASIQKNTNIMHLDGKALKLPTIVVYINNIYYLPEQILNYFK